MPIIRTSQMFELGASSKERLIQEQVARIDQSLPDVTATMAPGEVEQSVHLAIQKGEQYGLKEWTGICRYLDVMYILGFDFDEDSRYEWAREKLEDQDLSEHEKMDQVTELALKESEAAHPEPAE